MNLAVRRRLAVGALGTVTAVVAGFLALPNAQAATGTLTVNPNFAYNSETKTITLTPTSSGNPGYPPGSTVTFTRSGTSDSFQAQIDPSSPTAPTVTVDFTDVGVGVGGDGPANPGTYDVTIASPVGSTQYYDSCSACFTVLTPNANPSVSSVSPSSLAQGGTSNVTVTGTGFSRGSTIAVLLPDGSAPDPSITTNAAPKDSSGKDITSGITTNTTIQRQWTVGSTSATGPRDVRVTNVDGTSAVCPQCFTVNGGPLASVSPVAGSNNPNASLTRVTFNGTSLSSGEPRLVYVGDAGSSTKSDLTLVGTNASYSGTSVSADFDLRSAAPGSNAYQPALVQADGSQNTCACRFSVGQPAAATVTSLAQTSQAAGTSQTVRVTGTNFSKGVRINVSGTGVTTTAVTFVSPTEVDATFTVDGSAQNGPRDVTPVTTDGVTGTACKGCYTITGGGTSPSPTADATATPSPSGTPCPAPASASPSASPSASSGGGLPLPIGSSSPSASASASTSPTASASASASPTASATGLPLAINAAASSAACPQLAIAVSPADIVPNQASTVTVTGQPSTPVELYAYTQPNTTYGKVRSGTTDANGRISWNVTPGRNTRLYAHYARTGTTTASDDSQSTVITVHTSLSLSAYRDGVRQYHFQGTNLPRRAGQLITLYRYATGPNLDQYCVPTPESDTTVKSDGSCKAIITSQVKTGPDNTWRIDRTFTGSGRFFFVVRTGKTMENGRGHSNQRDTVIH